MGYSTDFTGEIAIDPPLNAQEIEYLNAFSTTRHHDGKDPYAVSNDLGMPKTIPSGYNITGLGKPGLWCNIVPTHDGHLLVWNGSEKSYDMTAWMKYIITHFLGHAPVAKIREPERFAFLQGHSLNGVLEAQGEEHDDRWELIVEDNIVKVVNL